MKRTISKTQWTGLVILIVGLVGYVFVFRDVVKDAYQGISPTWVDFVIEKLYPRFLVEKHRFSMDFFLQKTDMVVMRTGAIFLVALFLGQKLYDVVFAPLSVSQRNLTIYRCLLYGAAPLYYWDWLHELIVLSFVKEFYKPVLLLSSVFPTYPSIAVLSGIFILLIVSNVLMLIHRWLLVSGMVFALTFIVLEGFFLSFHKLDHGFATFIYCLLIFPWIGLLKKSPSKVMPDAWPIRLIWVAITLTYFMSGMEKLTISGWHWVMPETLQGYLALHHTKFGDFVSEYDWMCVSISVLGLVFQLGFVSVLFWPKMVWVFVPAGLAFHFLTGQLFQISGFISPWQVVYIFFVDWEKAWTIFSKSGFLYKTSKTNNG